MNQEADIVAPGRESIGGQLDLALPLSVCGIGEEGGVDIEVVGQARCTVIVGKCQKPEEKREQAQRYRECEWKLT